MLFVYSGNFLVEAEKDQYDPVSYTHLDVYKRQRPKSITVNLLANGIITDTKTVTADDNWTYSFTDLPKYANGQEITYTVSELTVPGYTTTIDDNYNITNSYTPGETLSLIHI